MVFVASTTIFLWFWNGAAVGRDLPRPQDVWSSPRFQREFVRGAAGTPRHLPQRKAPPSGSRQFFGENWSLVIWFNI